MALDYSNGAARALQLADTAAYKGRNEAQTRFELIDTILKDCLGWEAGDIQVEDRLEGRIADYVLGNPIQRAVIEAKREGTYFELPAGTTSGVASLRTLMSHESIELAVEQVLDYAQDRGIPVAAVANGHQLIVFLASRQDGIPPRDGRALVLASLQDLHARFRDVWDALSPAGAERIALGRLLRLEERPLPPEPLSDRLVDYPGYKNRNPVSAEFEILGGLFIEDVVHQDELEDEFLDACYLESGALSQYALVSKEILKKRYAALEDVAAVTARPARTKQGLSEDLLSSTLTSSLSRRPILLVGSVGVGKSIFIRRFITRDLEEAAPGSIALYVDYGAEPALADDLHAFTNRSLTEQLRDEYDIDIDSSGFLRSVYRSDLARFRSGPYGFLAETSPPDYQLKEADFLAEKIKDRDEHLRRSIEHLQAAQRRQTVVFLDNVDQRPAAFQESVFLIAQAMATSWPVTCFVSLRPDTFHVSKQSGTLAAYQPRVFTISPPRVDRVIVRRLEFALKLLDETGSLPSFPAGMSLESARLKSYIAMLVHAFRRNREIVEFVDNMSGGNVRRALDFLVSFIGSGHVDVQKILRILEDSGRYDLPLHEFVRAVIFDDYEYFDPSESPVANVFDIRSLDGKEHFLVPILVRTCERMGRSGSQAGFVATEDLTSRIQSLGFSPLQVAEALDDCASHRLLETSPDNVPGATSNKVRVTSAGVYTCKRLIELFSYVDAMIVATPIVDPEVRERLGDDRAIADRLDRCEVFCDYLEREWAPLDGAGSAFDWPTHASTLRSSIQTVRDRVERSISRASADGYP